MADALARRKVFLEKIESTEGTDSLPVPASDLVLPNGDINIELPTEQDMGEGELKGTFGPGASTTTKNAFGLAMTTRIRGLGQGVSALLTPSIHPALLSCGHTVVTAGDGSATARSAEYKPSSVLANLKTATRYWYADGLLYKLLGSVNDLSFEASMNALMAKYKVQSKYTDPAAQALPAWAAPTQKFFRMTNALCTVNEAGSPIQIGAFTFDTGSKVEETYETGFHGFRLADRSPTIKIDPRAVDGSLTRLNQLKNATSIAIVATFTNDIGETLVFTANVCTPSELGKGARAGRQIDQLSYSIKETTGDDQYTIKWTSVL